VKPTGFRADINGLRGLAVLLVVAYHLGLRGAAGGFIGVDAFFVVSGYLMTAVLLRRPVGSVRAYLGFMTARAQRIVPARAPIWLHQMRGSGKDRHRKQASIHRASSGEGMRSVTSRNSSSKKVCLPTMSSSSE